MEKGFVGLYNRGNTCYLNAAIQVLSNIPLLRDYFLHDEYIPDIVNRANQLKEKKQFNEILLTKEYVKLLKALWSLENPIEPKSFHELIQKYDRRFAGFEQQDSHEVLSFILDYLHEGLIYEVEIKHKGKVKNELDQLMVESIEDWNEKMKNKYSYIVEIFFGQSINKVTDEKDVIVSKQFEIFNMLNIPIYGNSLEESMNKYFEKENIENYFNETKNRYETVSREMKLMKIPKYLIIILKRYNNEMVHSTPQLHKKMGRVYFPIENLNLYHYTEGYDKYEANMNLLAIGCHQGGLNSGHYYSICRHTNGKWYMFNDEQVREVHMEREKENLYSSGYILVYERI
jgi:ubiquitin C-terminal hydrolase